MRTMIAVALLIVATACTIAPSPTVTPSPAPPITLPPAPVPWLSVWTPLTWTNGVWTGVASVSGRTEEAFLQIICDETLRSTEVRVLFDLDIGERPDLSRYSAPYATAEAKKIVTRRGQAAKAANDTLHQIHIARREIGETGRWMKSGWRHYPSTGGYLVLRHAPAAAFIDEIAEVEEFAVLITHDHGADTAAVFDVRSLSRALRSAIVGWGCA